MLDKLWQSIRALMDLVDYYHLKWAMSERLNASYDLEGFTKASLKLDQYRKIYGWR
jgi:hypothetical protein